MKQHLQGGAKQGIRVFRTLFYPITRVGALGLLAAIGCFRETAESWRVERSPKLSSTDESGASTNNESIPPRQMIGDPANILVHRSSQGQAETRILSAAEPLASVSQLHSGDNREGPSLAEVAPTIMGTENVPSPSHDAGVRWVDLSVPVSLPQTGPEGTMMSFGVEYRLRAEAPRDQTYTWAIQSRTGKLFRMDALRLESQGNLMTIVTEWRPEDGPFRTWMEDSAGRRVSLSLGL